MASVNKLALVKLTLKSTFDELTPLEKLCVLTDLYAPQKDVIYPRWSGQHGEYNKILEQGIYNSMITFRRVADLWAKWQGLLQNPNSPDPPDMREERKLVRDWVMADLDPKLVDEITDKQ
jgi:hypothetical protein